MGQYLGLGRGGAGQHGRALHHVLTGRRVGRGHVRQHRGVHQRAAAGGVHEQQPTLRGRRRRSEPPGDQTPHGHRRLAGQLAHRSRVDRHHDGPSLQRFGTVDDHLDTAWAAVDRHRTGLQPHVQSVGQRGRQGGHARCRNARRAAQKPAHQRPHKRRRRFAFLVGQHAGQKRVSHVTQRPGEACGVERFGQAAVIGPGVVPVQPPDRGAQLMRPQVPAARGPYRGDRVPQRVGQHGQAVGVAYRHPTLEPADLE